MKPHTHRHHTPFHIQTQPQLLKPRIIKVLSWKGGLETGVRYETDGQFCLK